MAPGRPGAAAAAAPGAPAAPAAPGDARPGAAEPGAAAHHSAAGPTGSLRDGLEAVTGEYERRAIADSLRRNGGNKSRTARELSITRKTLAQKIAKYGLQQ